MGCRGGLKYFLVRKVESQAEKEGSYVVYACVCLYASLQLQYDLPPPMSPRTTVVMGT